MKEKLSPYKQINIMRNTIDNDKLSIIESLNNIIQYSKGQKWILFLRFPGNFQRIIIFRQHLNFLFLFKLISPPRQFVALSIFQNIYVYSFCIILS